MLRELVVDRNFDKLIKGISLSLSLWYCPFYILLDVIFFNLFKDLCVNVHEEIFGLLFSSCKVCDFGSSVRLAS